MHFSSPRTPLSGRKDSTPSCRRAGQVALALLGAVSLGCTGEASGETDSESGSVHAAVRVQNVTRPDGEAQGDALAGFVHVPADVEATQVLSLAGLQLQFPPRGECFSEAEMSADLMSLSYAELLEAREVVLENEDGSHELAPYAFPSVADLRGAMYLSRDRETALPTGGTYTLLGSGIQGEEGDFAVTTTQQSPPPLSGVALDGVELSGTIELSPRRVLDLSWDSSDDSNDLIVVTVENEDEYWACSFSDSEEFGSIPLLTDEGKELGLNGQESLVSVHRVRTFEAGEREGVDEIHVTFDFAVQASVVFDDINRDSQ